MDDTTSTNSLSPLDQVRLVEAEISRKIAAAREAAEHEMANAGAQASQIRKEAQEQGGREGQIRHKEIVERAGEQARMMTAQAQTEAASLRRRGESRMAQAVREALNVILGLKGGGGAHES